MTIDLEQFHQVFFEESVEGLDIMEAALMELDVDALDDETINAIFRSAHSIKGGSATFGFSSIAEFTHVLETFLDQVRAGQRALSADDINILLRSVDCMREMLEQLKSGQDGATELAAQLKKQFENLLTDQTAAPVDAPTTDAAQATAQTWRINFAPKSEIFLSGNDPLRNIQALADLGELSLCCAIDALPTLSDLDPEKSYLSWSMSLFSACSEDQIREIFEWIEDECDLDIAIAADDEAQLPNSHQSLCSGTEAWHIRFKPALDLLRTGNDIVRMFKALSDFGELKVQCDSKLLPELQSMDAENCYLEWSLTLCNSTASRSEIEAVFEWVLDDCALKIEAAQGAGKDSVEHASEPVNKQSAPKEKDKKIPATSPAKKLSGETSSIRVGIDKVDSLINMVGELVITQSMLGQLGTQYELDRVPKLMEGLSQLEQNTRELQESVMKIRMLPISFVFSRFPRMVRDLGQSLGKSVELVLNGESTELDKTVMEKIGDPLVHLVRNAVDHGIETPAERAEQGKDPSGHIELNAFHQSGNVVIEICDDGRGLDRSKLVQKAIENELINERDAEAMTDEQVYDLIFQPGFSTAKEVSDVSGRGVGMDVVKRNIQALNGHVEIQSNPGAGSKITVKLPLTLAILDGQLVRVGDNTYVFPLVSIVESLQCQGELVRQVGGGCSVFKLRDDYVPIIELYKAFSVEPESTSIEESLLVVVEADGEKYGIVVDELLGQQQVVIKSLEQNYQRVEGISGATILGDGTVALILDIQSIVKLAAERLGVKTQTLGLIVGNQKSELKQPHQAAG
ncbi:chemotaxis protein CheA [Agaribacterium haliotis]|uniref:chemotaxis protein CheA n=1 Tax=Agaribacterium haliotis TaxID=2013869 RepID=UPI000BB573E7|nr:chemotaxis protein CheA [Agaribacterium haliotis]